jgi:hypothetical protein
VKAHAVSPLLSPSTHANCNKDCCCDRQAHDEVLSQAAEGAAVAMAVGCGIDPLASAPSYLALRLR